MKAHSYLTSVAAALMAAAGLSAQTATKVDFTSQVAPILEQKCVQCHGPALAAGKLVVTSRASLLEHAVVPGKPAASSLYVRTSLPADQPGAMPPGGPRLPEDQLAALKDWIEQGADWPTGVALKVPAAPAPAAKAAPSDPQEIVREIHARIVEKQKEKAADMKAYSVNLPNTTIRYDMAPIPAGEFIMGSSDADKQRQKDEQPAHPVKVDAFWMQAHEVTWDEYRLFMFRDQANESANPDGIVDAVSRPTRPYMEMSFGMGINGYPAISMTQHAANQYAQWLSAKTGEFYRLPTEAEWEYACRAGSTTAYPFGDDPAALDEYAWYSANSKGAYQQVAKKKPNAWGLFDIEGNVMEWTLDQYGPYPAGEAVNPWVKATQPYPHAVRGGSWRDTPDKLRCAARVASDSSWKQQDPQIPKSIWYHTDAQWLGFRLVRPATIPTAEEMYNYWYNGVQDEY